jgi:predicted nucleic acid-binding protein
VGLIEELPRTPVAVDASIFIYLVERHREYVDIVRPVFIAADKGERELVTSAVTLLEVLVVPLRTENHGLARDYQEVLTASRGIRLVDVDHTQLRAAAGLRAKHGLRTPDALQLAAALTTGCAAFVTNDGRLRDLPGLRVLQLRDFR